MKSNERIKFCPNCNVTRENSEALFDDENIQEFFKGYLYLFTINEETKICPCCKKEGLADSLLTYEEIETIQEASNSNRQFLEAMIKLKETDIIEYESRMSQFRNQVQQQKVAEKALEEESSKPKLTCPKCGSSEVTEGTRGFTLTTGFLGSGKFRYVCKRCGNKWKPGSMLETLQRANNHHWDD